MQTQLTPHPIAASHRAENKELRVSNALRWILSAKLTRHCRCTYDFYGVVFDFSQGFLFFFSPNHTVTLLYITFLVCSPRNIIFCPCGVNAKGSVRGKVGKKKQQTLAVACVVEQAIKTTTSVESFNAESDSSFFRGSIFSSS